MKIVITFHPYNPIIMGLASSLTSLSNDVITWSPKIKPPFDMFDELKPDLLFCTENDFSSGLISAIQEYNINFVVVGLNYPQNLKPQLICIPQIPEQIKHNIKHPYYTLLQAANIVQFNNGHIEEKYKSEILHISNITIEDHPNIITTLEQLCMTDYMIKIVGFYTLPMFAQYIGQANIKHITNFLTSSNIILDFKGNILLDAALNKAFCLSDTPNNLYPHFSDYEELSKQIKQFINNDQYKKSYINKAYKYAKQNTYLHRVSDILKILNCSELSHLALSKVEEILCNN